jgi:hypothetical protein
MVVEQAFFYLGFGLITAFASVTASGMFKKIDTRQTIVGIVLTLLLVGAAILSTQTELIDSVVCEISNTHGLRSVTGGAVACEG